MQTPIKGLSLTGKLFLFVFLSFSLLVGGLIYLVSLIAEREADASIATALERSRSIVETALGSHYAAIVRAARDVARDPKFFAALESPDTASESLQDLSEEAARSLSADVLIITDKHGRILARSDEPELVANSTSTRSELVSSVLSGREGYGIMRRKNELLQIGAVPVTLPNEPGNVVGVAALAYRLSPELMREMKNLTASEIAIFSLPEAGDGSKAAPLLQSATIDGAEGAASSPLVKLGPELYQSTVLALKRSDGHEEGFIAVLRSRSELLRPFQNIERHIAGYGFGFLILASLIAAYLARRVARPIVELAGITRAIEGGAYPEPVASKRRDEVGALQNAVYAMSEGLREKAEVERYLAQFSSALEVDSGKPVELEAEFVKVGGEVRYVPRQKASALSAPIEENAQPLFAGRYRMKQLLGEGAFGSVYLAEDPELGELLALKIIPKSTFSAADLENIKREIRLARKITHRNVVRTYDFGIDGDNYYISMEYVPGYDLYQLIKQNAPLPLTIGVQLARQIVSAVAVAHQEGIIHRDLKPQNMIVNRQGILKIMDFGLALQVKAPATAISKTELARAEAPLGTGDNIRIGATMAGSPYYMAPEQFTGGILDERTDVYALGVVMFHMFSGVLPFKEKLIFNLVERIVKEPAPRLSSVLKNCPPQLDEIIAKALAKSPSERFSSMEELSKFLSTPIITARAA